MTEMVAGVMSVVLRVCVWACAWCARVMSVVEWAAFRCCELVAWLGVWLQFAGRSCGGAGGDGLLVECDERSWFGVECALAGAEAALAAPSREQRPKGPSSCPYPRNGWPSVLYR